MKTTPDEHNETNKLLDIFKQADEWLMRKEGSGSSRYNQVINLRDNVYTRLRAIAPEKQTEINKINLNSLCETKYFEKHWQREIKSASWFQTPATDKLNAAFKEHGKANEPSKENDQTLLKAINAWIDAKKPNEAGAKSSSRRFELVVNIKEKLKKVMKQYENKHENENEKDPIQTLQFR